ncbi:MAG: T9SS type A sorting domain-containing protein [Flavobacteriales bacterium]|nr:T9SS type A sorting domain-containing protein [Flavobacteriales bacterium]
MFTLDVDGNDSKDLVLGGSTYDNLLLLINDDASPNLTSSSISNQQSDFPAQNISTVALDLEHFPAGYYFDVNNDGINDLICANNSTSLAKNNTNVWHYENNNVTNNPDFSLVTTSFLQEGMIEIGEGAYPTFFDHNSDGLIDIVVGGYGYYNSAIPEYYVSSLWLYENIGTPTNPSYQLVDSNYANMNTMNLDLGNNSKTLGLAPTYGDIDGDGDIDMIVGDYIGFLHYFENTAGAGNTANFVLNQARYAGIDVGNNATPQLIDLNRDLLLDLVIGKENGLFTYYENIGSSSAPIFSFVTDSLGKICTRRFFEFNGNSVPYLFDDDGVYKMFSGAANGYIYLFENIDGNLTGTFSIDSSFQGIWEGIHSTVNLSDINNDGKPDMLIGNYAGGAAFYEGGLFTSSNQKIEDTQSIINIYPNPTRNTLNIDFGKNNIKNSSIEIMDLLGKVIYNQKVENNNIVIDLQKLPQGIYLLKFKNNLGSEIHKIIKH